MSILNTLKTHIEKKKFKEEAVQSQYPIEDIIVVDIPTSTTVNGYYFSYMQRTCCIAGPNNEIFKAVFGSHKGETFSLDTYNKELGLSSSKSPRIVNDPNILSFAQKEILDLDNPNLIKYIENHNKVAENEQYEEILSLVHPIM